MTSARDDVALADEREILQHGVAILELFCIRRAVGWALAGSIFEVGEPDNAPVAVGRYALLAVMDASNF